MLNKIKNIKLRCENELASLPIKIVFFKIFLLGNFVLGVTSGAFNRAFYLILKYTNYAYMDLLYALRIALYFWVVFYGGFSLILMLQRFAELPRWTALSIMFYLGFSFFSLFAFETFLPFQQLGGELFNSLYKLF